MSPVELRSLTLADAEAGALLSAHIGWNHTPQTWAQVLRWNGVQGIGLFDGPELVATTVALEYGPTLAWIGYVITHPEHQKRGYARHLMEYMVTTLRQRQVRSIMLDASELGYPLYVSMGFQSLYAIESWTGTGGGSPPTASAVRQMTAHDVEAVIALDAGLISLARREVIAAYWTPGASWVWEQAGQVRGYLLARQRPGGWFFGPWYHPDLESAAALFQTAMAASPGQPVRADIPAPNSAARTILQEKGLSPTGRTIRRMILEGEAPGRMTAQYSVASFATG